MKIFSTFVEQGDEGFIYTAPWRGLLQPWLTVYLQDIKYLSKYHKNQVYRAPSYSQNWSLHSSYKNWNFILLQKWWSHIIKPISLKLFEHEMLMIVYSADMTISTATKWFMLTSICRFNTLRKVFRITWLHFPQKKEPLFLIKKRPSHSVRVVYRWWRD